MVDRHYHCWIYERDADGTINLLRRRPETFEKRRQAIYNLQRFRFMPGVTGHVMVPGQVLACDDRRILQTPLRARLGLHLHSRASDTPDHPLD